MPAGWFGGNRESDDDIQFKPEEFQSKIKDDVKSEISSSLAPVLEFIRIQNEEKAAKVEADRLAAEEASNRRTAPPTSTDYITDPQGATLRALQPLQQHTLQLAAKMAKQDTLGDQDYYTGEIKTKIDLMLSKQPLENQSSPDVIMNAYKIVVFDHQKDIAEGKIKGRNSAAIFGGTGTGGHNANDPAKAPDFMSNEEKSYAAKLGISEKDWVESRSQLEYV